MFHGSTGRLGRQCECGGEGDADTLAASFNACQTIFSMRWVMVFSCGSVDEAVNCEKQFCLFVQ